MCSLNIKQISNRIHEILGKGYIDFDEKSNLSSLKFNLTFYKSVLPLPNMFIFKLPIPFFHIFEQENVHNTHTHTCILTYYYSCNGSLFKKKIMTGICTS